MTTNRPDITALCAKCLRMVKDPRTPVFVRPANSAGYEVTPMNLAGVIEAHGVARIDSPADGFLLFAVTLVNGELRCAWHVD